jgi:hypothetical protein
MSQVRVTSGSNTKWIGIAVAAVAVVGAAAYWFTGSEDVSDAARVTDAGSSAVTAPSPSVPETVFSNPNPSVEEAQAALAQQKEAAKVIEAQPDMKPITGPITERPSFVSPMEWAMLQGVVQQHAQPDKELTRMVNFLRFMKQLEALDALPKTAENAAKRKALASQLVEDLPNRVRGGDLEFKDAQGRLAEWLPEVEPDAQKRQERSDKVGKLLSEAAESYKAAEAAANQQRN